MAINLNDIVRSVDWTAYGILPEQAASNLTNAGFWIDGATFTPAGNALFSTLVNKIGMTYFDSLRSVSLYEKYTKKTGANIPYGQYLEQIHIEPARPQDFKTGAPNGNISPFVRNEPEIKVLYNPINYDIQFPISVNIPDVQGAFSVSNGVTNYVRALIKSLYAGADDASDTTFLALLGEIATVASQSPTQSISVAPVTDRDSALAYVQSVITLISRMRFRDSQFNTMHARQKYLPSELIYFTRTETDAALSVQRATTYHADFTALGVEVDVVPDFEGITAVTSATPAAPLYPIYNAESGKRTGWTLTQGGTTPYTGAVISQDPHKQIVGLLCAKQHPLVLTQFSQLSDDLNKRTYTRNYWLTERKLFGLTPFHNAIVFTTPVAPVSEA